MLLDLCITFLAFETASKYYILFRISSSHSGGHESSVFWDITPCSPVKVSGPRGLLFPGVYYIFMLILESL
jgi:hypothetical protein